MSLPIKYTDAAILVEQNKNLVIDKVQLPEKLEIGQVLVEVHVSGICGSQIGEIRGAKGSDNYLPHLLGHEGCATVLEVGPGVKSVKPSDLVVLHWRPGKGIESDTPKYFLGGKQINAGWVTTFNSKAIISENRCTKVPKNTNHELAAMFGCAITTGFGVVENNAKLKIGESVVIFGSGTGNPFFTTDSAAVLRAIEINADVILKGTRVDGIYNLDPEKSKDAIKFEYLTFDDAIKKKLKVMDSTAFTLSKENNLPIIVFNINKPGNLKKVIEGKQVGTIVN